MKMLMVIFLSFVLLSCASVQKVDSEEILKLSYATNVVEAENINSGAVETIFSSKGFNINNSNRNHNIGSDDLDRNPNKIVTKIYPDKVIVTLFILNEPICMVIEDRDRDNFTVVSSAAKRLHHKIMLGSCRK